MFLPQDAGAAPSNPMAVMALLPPEVWTQIVINLFVIIGSSAVLIWDILDNLSSDYILLTSFTIRFPTIAYLSSRISALAYFLVMPIMLSAPVSNCSAWSRASSWLFVTTLATTSLLFLLRVRAVYNNKLYPTIFFTVFWIIAVLGCATLPFAIQGINLGPTKYCVQTSPEWYLIAAAVAPFVNDTIVYLAITWRLTQTASQDSNRLSSKLRVIVFGHTLPRLPRALLRDGQSYYLLTVVLRGLVLILFPMKSLPPLYRSILGQPAVALIHISACRVFRHTRFGLFPDSSTLADRTRRVPLSGETTRLTTLDFSVTRGTVSRVDDSDPNHCPASPSRTGRCPSCAQRESSKELTVSKGDVSEQYGPTHLGDDRPRNCYAV